MLSGHLHLFLCEVSVKVIFIELLVFLLSSTDSLLVCVLDASPLSGMCFAKNFFQPVACLFILLLIYFDEQAFLFLLKLSLLCGFFLPLGHSCFLNPFKETAAHPKGHQDILLPFSSSSFLF